MVKSIYIFTVKYLWLMATLASAVGILLAYTSRYVSPEEVWWLAFFGLAYPFLLLANVICMCYWGIKRSFFFTIPAIAILLGFNWHGHVIKISFGDNDMLATQQKLKVMSYNVCNFKAFDFDKNIITKQKIIQLIASENPDIVCFQEYQSLKKKRKSTSFLLDSLAHLPYKYTVAISENDYELIGNSIYSKYPIKQKVVLPFSKILSGNSGQYVDIEVNNKTIRVFNVHLQSINFGRDDYKYFEGLSENLDPDLAASKKIGSRLKHAFIQRARQADLIQRQILSSPYPVIVCGDFNDTPISYTFKTIATGLRHTFKEAGNGFARTYSGLFPNFQIDYILTSPSISVLKYKIVKEKLSDHYPVVSELGL